MRACFPARAQPAKQQDGWTGASDERPQRQRAANLHELSWDYAQDGKAAFDTATGPFWM